MNHRLLSQFPKGNQSHLQVISCRRQQKTSLTRMELINRKFLYHHLRKNPISSLMKRKKKRKSPRNLCCNTRYLSQKSWNLKSRKSPGKKRNMRSIPRSLRRSTGHNLKLRNHTMMSTHHLVTVMMLALSTTCLSVIITQTTPIRAMTMASNIIYRSKEDRNQRLDDLLKLESQNVIRSTNTLVRRNTWQNLKRLKGSKRNIISVTKILRRNKLRRSVRPRSKLIESVMRRNDKKESMLSS